MPIAPRSATILGVQAAQTTTTGELPLTESHACASGLAHAYRRAQPHGFVRNRWYLAANRDARVEWDFEDRLVKVTKADGTVVENVYDVDGVLVRTAVDGVGTDLLVDTSGGLSHVVAEVDSTGTVTVLYVRAGGMLLEEVRGGVAKMYEADGLGSVRGLLDVSGAKTDTYAYEAFGSTLLSTGTDANPYRFAGERLVDSVGLYQNRARWMDTRTGRFVSVDPAEGKPSAPLSLHRYLYGSADPTNRGDPSGRFDGLAGLMVNLAVQFVESSTSLTSATTVRVIKHAYDLLNDERNRLEPGVVRKLQPSFSGFGVDLQDVVVVLGTPRGNALTKGRTIFLPTPGPGQSGYDSALREVFHELGHVGQNVAAVQIDPTNGEQRLQNRYNQETYYALQSGHLLADEVFDEANVGARYEQPVELKAMDLGMLTRYRLLNPLFTLDAQCDRLRDILWDRRDSLGLK